MFGRNKIFFSCLLVRVPLASVDRESLDLGPSITPFPPTQSWDYFLSMESNQTSEGQLHLEYVSGGVTITREYMVVGWTEVGKVMLREKGSGCETQPGIYNAI